ncbi:MAG: SH3 domain-containing protein [Gemmatimonadaceae bacterium]
MRYHLFGVIIIALLPAIAISQTTVIVDSRLTSAPNGRSLAQLRPGAVVRVTGERGSVSQVTIQGFVHSGSLGGKRDTFAVTVRSPSGVLLRTGADRSAKAVGKLLNGMGLHVVSRRGEWVQVRRTGWIRTRALAKKPSASAAPRGRSGQAQPQGVVAAESAGSAAVTPDPQPPDEPLPDDLTPLRRTRLSSAPDGQTLATIEPATRLTPVARDRGWVRVQLEGWMRETDLEPADTAVRGSLSAADLRANPEAFRGRTVRWAVQVIALQTADPLRRDMAQDEPYLLARGPGRENALLYLVLPSTLVETGRSIPPLSNAIVTARVRTGRSDPSGVPILDVLSLARQ